VIFLSLEVIQKLRNLDTCANLKVDVNIAKILVGKSVDKSMLTYLSEVEHKNVFLEVKEVLGLTNGRIKSEVELKDKEITKLKKEREETKLLLKGMTQLFGQEILEKAKQQMQVRKDTGKPLTPLEALKIIGKTKQQQDQQEYQKLIEENNNH
jgi:hypothetical protein